jgi:hypothetical protein
MNNKQPVTSATWILGVGSCVVAFVLTALAVWSFILGEFPTIRTGENSYMTFAAFSVDGVILPDWAFYFIPTGISVIAMILAYVGWRFGRTRDTNAN